MADTRQVIWRINKARPNRPRLSTYSLGEFSKVGDTASFTVTSESPGEVYIISSSPYISVQVLGTRVLVTILEATYADVSIVIGISESTNYLAYDSEDVICTLKIREPIPVYNRKLTLTVPRYNIAAGSVGDYAVFAGGVNNAVSYYNTVDMFDTALNRRQSRLNTARGNAAATSISNYLIIAGGEHASGSYANVPLMSAEAIDSSGTVRSVQNLYRAVSHLAGTTTGKIAIFAGGRDFSGMTYHDVSNAAAYTASGSAITVGSATALSSARRLLKACHVGNIAIFGGGSAYSRAVDAYSSSFTRTTLTRFSTGRILHAAASNEEYAIFSGGVSDNGTLFSMEIYDASGTKIETNAELSIARQGHAGAGLGGFILFGGGFATASNVDPMSSVEIFDKSLTLMSVGSISVPRSSLEAVAAGDNVFFGGGVKAINREETPDDAVDVYSKG